MKKTIQKLMLMIVAITTSSFVAMAQQMPPVPTDPQVRIGKLDNGLTYYLRHNEYPKGLADFYIVQKVGSVQENDNQRGLAHFLEHMCFNGTKHFPGNTLIEWLETVGVKFGVNLNAATNLDETTYRMTNVPTARTGVQDSCLLVIQDWANGLLLDGEEIDKERKVIHEEWRSQMPPTNRMLERALPVIMPDSRYAHRMPIGTMEVVDNFPHQLLRDYYKDWYRPDLQSIVVVGDVDIDRIEQKIKEMFSSIQTPADAPKWERYPIADNQETIVCIEKDKEQPNTIIQLYFKYDNVPDAQKNNVGYLANQYLMKMIDRMLAYRLNEVMMKKESPLAVAQSVNGNFLVSAKQALTLAGLPKGTDIKSALKALYREALRIQRHGFTATEYARMRSEYLSALEKEYKNRNQQENNQLVQACINHFLRNEPLPGIEQEYQLMNMLVNQIPVEAVNQVYRQLVKEHNKVVLCMLPDKEGVNIPTEEELAQAMKEVDAEKIAPYVDNVKTEPLISQLPAPGKVIGEKRNELFDATEWTLSNGAKVIVKPTTFKEDEVSVSIVAKGGTSVYGEEDASNLIAMPYMLMQYGLGKYTFADLNKYMAGKQARLSYKLSDYSRNIDGSSTPKDLVTLMELIYMGFTSLNITADEFAALQQTYLGVLQNQASNPDFVFAKQLQEAVYPSDSKQAPSAETFAKINRERMLQIIHEQLGNAADFTFVFSGNVQTDELKKLVEQYIATLPGDAKKTTNVKHDNRLEMVKGSFNKRNTFKMEVPQSHVAVLVSAQIRFTAKNKLLTDFAAQIISTRLLAEVREKEGATYSIQTQGELNRLEKVNLSFLTQFKTKPEMLDKSLEIIRQEFDKLCQQVGEEEFAKVKEYMVKLYTKSLKENLPWSKSMANYQLCPEDSFVQGLDLIEKLTPKDVSSFVKQVMKQGNYQVVILSADNRK